MRCVTSTLIACALAGGVNLFAQEQAPPSQAGKEPAPKSTLTGCVVQAKTTDGGTAYVLSKVEGGTSPMYVLSGSTSSDWASNVNKKVEVTGAVQTPPPDPGGEAAADPKVLRPPMVIVESVKVVAQACT